MSTPSHPKLYSASLVDADRAAKRLIDVAFRLPVDHPKVRHLWGEIQICEQGNRLVGSLHCRNDLMNLTMRGPVDMVGANIARTGTWNVTTDDSYKHPVADAHYTDNLLNGTCIYFGLPTEDVLIEESFLANQLDGVSRRYYTDERTAMCLYGLYRNGTKLMEVYGKEYELDACYDDSYESMLAEWEAQQGLRNQTGI